MVVYKDRNGANNTDSNPWLSDKYGFVNKWW